MNAELWTADEVAEYLGASTAASVRRTLSRWGVPAVDYVPHPTSKRPRALYSADAVRAAKASRPGRGSRTDLR